MIIRLSDGSTVALAVRQVHSYMRNEHGRLEHVHGYLADGKKPGPAFHGWIIPQKWKAGQQEWIAKGEAAWRGGPAGHGWVVRHPTSPSGDTLAPGVKQLTFPGMPKPQLPRVMGETEEKSRLKSAQASGIVSVHRPGAHVTVDQDGVPGGADGNNYFGNSGKVRDVTFKNGSEWIAKRLSEDGAVSAQVQRASEVLASHVSAAIGAGAPPVVDEDGELWEPKVDGEPAIEWIGGTDDNDQPIGRNDPVDMYTTPQGQRIGILDILLANQDRHYGNWLVATGKDGTEYPVPIDHGLAFLASISDSPFAAYVRQASISSPTWRLWQERLEKLKPEFASYGMLPEYEAMMSRFNKIARGL